MTSLISAAAVSACTIGRTTTGNSTVKRVPRPGSLFTSIVRPCSWMMPRHWDSPSPVPSPGGCVVKKGSKSRARISGAMPGPVSERYLAGRMSRVARERPRFATEWWHIYAARVRGGRLISLGPLGKDRG